MRRERPIRAVLAGVACALAVGSAPAPARAQGPDPERAQISEIRAAFFELVDGRPLDALARLRHLGPLRAPRPVSEEAAQGCREDSTNAGGGKLILCAASGDAFPRGGEADRLFLLAESYDALGMSDSLRATGDRMLSLRGEGPLATLVRIQLLMHRDSVSSDLLAHTLTHADSTDRAQLRRAEIAYDAGSYDSAAALAATIPAGSAADAQARWTRALALGRLGAALEARSALAGLARDYPDLPEGREASFLAAQLMLDAGDPAAAERAFATVADSAGKALDAVTRDAATTTAANILISSRTADALLVDGPALSRAKVLAPPAAAATERNLLGAVRADDGDPAGAPMPTFQVLTARAVMARLDSANALFARSALFVADSPAVRMALAHGIETLRAADLDVGRATDALDALGASAAAEAAIMRGQRALVLAAGDSVAGMAASVQAISDSAARLTPGLDSAEDRIRRIFADQIASLRELAAENGAVADSMGRRYPGALTPDDRAVLARETAAAAIYGRLADTVERALPAVLARHPTLALRDSLLAHAVATRALIGDVQRSAIAAAAAIDTAIAHLPAGGSDSVSRAVRVTLVDATARQRAAIAVLTPAVERDLAVRRNGVRSALARDREAADFGAAHAAFHAVLAAGDTVAPVERDSAIGRLTTVLDRYAASPGRPAALHEAGELLARRADAQFAAAQRDAAGGVANPDYGPAVARLEELVRRYPQYGDIDAAAYTLGTLYAFERQFQKAIPAFELVATRDSSPYRAEALFRLGDARFELASAARGDARRSLFADAADAYERDVASAPHDGDLYLLGLYKLGWSYYSSASREHPDGYQKAVDVFARLIDAYDSLPPERQARLGLRGEAVEYMAVSFTQIGGAAAAERYFASRPDTTDRIQVLRRIAARLRDQGDFSGAVAAYQELFDVAPGDTGALSAQTEVIDIYQSRTLEPNKAQAARLAFVDRFAPGFTWSASHPDLAKQAATMREQILRDAAQYELAAAQETHPVAAGNAPPPAAPAAPAAAADRRTHYTAAVTLTQRYLSDYGTADSAGVMTRYYAEALFGAGDYAAAAAQYTRAALATADAATPALREAARVAAQNAIVAYDSALARDSSDRGVQDSLFAAVDRYATRYPASDVARHALIEKGHRASQSARWDVVAATFRTYVQQYPADPYTPTAAKLIGDALYRQGRYAEAQAQWDTAAGVATRSGRRTLADSLRHVETAAASTYADSLVRTGKYDQAVREVYLPYADRNPGTIGGADALRNAVESERTADSVAHAHGDSAGAAAARDQAIAFAQRLIRDYPAYKFRLQYATLLSDLLNESGRSTESIQALQQEIADNPTWPGRADAEIRLAVRLDSLGHKADAAAAYERFATDYPKDARAHDALYNAAATELEARDTVGAARAYGAFSARFPDDARAGAARVYRMNLLQAHGDSAAAATELAALCRASPPEELQPRCARQAGQVVFAAGVAEFRRYRSIPLVIATRAQLTAAGLKRASAPKLELLAALSRDFSKAISSGDPVLLSAATFYVGAAQWAYGDFLRTVRLPSSLTDAERTAAQQGAAQQAAAYYDQAKATWADLLAKATEEHISNVWVERAHTAVTTGEVPNDL
jgi:tetratricopeptide (TPR) repeat protein